MKNPSFLTFIIVVCFLFINCKKTKTTETPNLISTTLTGQGRLTNLTGFDGCGWIIQLDYKEPNGNERFEAVNLNKFNIPLIEGQKVIFTYKEIDFYSVCMVGSGIELQSINMVF